ncbi:MAG: radical SAM protein [Anaerolineaceae bacterium]|nr:radical SAM protein [Anaerolineaceae bacterium]
MSRLSLIYSKALGTHRRSGPLRKKIGLFRTWASGHPMWMAWQVTYRCNLQCSFCNYWKSPSHPQEELTTDEFREASERLARLGAIFISLAGGEPLVRDDIVDIVEAVARYHFPFVTTNGWKATEPLAREMFEAGLWGVSVSLDYSDPRRHDTQRGREGAYDRAVAAIEMFSKARKHPWQRVNLMCVLVDDNLGEIEKLLKLAGRLDAYLMVQPYSQLKTGDRRFLAGAGVSEHLLGLRRRYPNFLSNPYFLGHFDHYLSEGAVPGCRAGRAFCNIDERGDVAICVEKRDRTVGNVLTSRPGELVRGLREAARANRCHNCWYNCRGEIEALYHPWGLLKSLPTYIFNRGRPSQQPNWPCDEAAG